MVTESDYQYGELRCAVIKLRTDLRFTPQTGGRRPGYVVEDPARSKFYRVGLPEYTFISLLDGKTPMGRAKELAAEALPEAPLTDADVAAICRWLLEANLAHVAGAAGPSRAMPLAEAGRRNLLQRLNPIVIRLPLLFPDGAFRRAAPWLGWLYSRPVAGAWCLLMAAAGYQIAVHWHRLVASSHQVFAPGNWLWLGLCWLVLKMLHETSHGLACKRYGGEVREMGLVLILLAPIAYVDVTSSWRFRSKWQRIVTATAGMYAELACAALAVLVWSHTERAVLAQLCLNVAAMAGLSTLVFNANPLMRFDGYYILSDLLGLQNLYSNGQRYLRYWCLRYLLGVRVPLPKWPRADGVIIRVYAVAALCWRVTVCASLLLGAAVMFQGAGVLLAAFGAALWLGVPLGRFAGYLLRGGPPAGQPHRLRFGMVMACGAAATTTVLLAVPWPGTIRAPALVAYQPLAVVRADSAGFVRRICVRAGESVQQGKILAVLENDELRAQLADLDLQIAQSRLRGRQHQNQQEMAALQAENAAREALLKQRDQLRRQVERLTVRAPIAGQVIGRHLAALAGVYLEQGDKLLEIGCDDRKELRASIAQEDVPRFERRVGRPMDVHLPGRAAFAATLDRIAPRARREPLGAALCAPMGGPLSVCRKQGSTEANGGASYELLAPRFTGVLRLDGAQSERLRAGQTGSIFLRDADDAILPHVYRLLERWVRTRLGGSS